VKNIRRFTLGEQIRIGREKRGFPQFYLAHKLGVSPATLCQYENSTRPIPRDIVANVAKLLHITELLEGECAMCPVAWALNEMCPKDAA